MKIITYNVNGLRAALSKGFTQWLVNGHLRLNEVLDIKGYCGK